MTRNGRPWQHLVDDIAGATARFVEADNAYRMYRLPNPITSKAIAKFKELGKARREAQERLEAAQVALQKYFRTHSSETARMKRFDERNRGLAIA